MNDRDFAMSILDEGRHLSRLHVSLRHGRDLLVYWIDENSDENGVFNVAISSCSMVYMREYGRG